MIRTRFAPSPTGYLHVGGARTALFDYLFTKHHQGVFILRIEDTDLERSTPEAVQAILDGMNWLGLHTNEGPFYQTQRFGRYHEVIQQFIVNGHAYRCRCSKERLEKLRAEQLENKEKPRYDGHCRNLNLEDNGEAFVVRFKNPVDGEVIVKDAVHGDVVFKNQELDDLIIARSDGSPTYNFTVVVDDADMQISHVIRGDDHLNNTPRQINMLIAMGAKIPVYAHLPMILGSDGKKLSKRHGAVSVMQYRDDGFLPEALLNYLVRLGWAHGDQEIFSMQEMIENFSLDHLSKSAAAFNTEKLLWLNQHYIKTLAPEYVADALRWHFNEQALDEKQGPTLTDLVIAQRERCKTLKEMAEKSRFFYSNMLDENFVKETFTKLDPPAKDALHKLLQTLSSLTETEWQDEKLHNALEECAKICDVKLGKIAQPLRVAVTGGTVSPSINVTLRLLGKAKTIARLEKALQ